MATNISSLQALAAKEYLDVIRRSSFIKNINNYTWRARVKKYPFEQRDVVEEIAMSLDIEKPNLLRKSLAELMQYLTEKLESLPKVQEVLKYHMMVRAECPDSGGSDAILQLLFSTNVLLLQRSQYCYIMFIAALGQRFDNIKTLLAYECNLNDQMLELCLPMFPKLRVLKICVDTANLPHTFEVIRRLAPHLEELCLPQLPVQYLNDDLLSQFLFSGSTLKKVEKQFAEGVRIKISFPRLKRLSIPFELPSYISLFRMLLFSYEGCCIDWLPQLDDFVKVSVFDAALCPAIIVCPNLATNLCELRFEDLRFQYVKDVCTDWMNLKTLRFIMGQSYMHVDLNFAQKTLAAIFANCRNLTCFQLVIASSNVEKGYECALNVLKKHGHKIIDFKLVDPYQTLTHKDIIDALNSVPNVRRLHLKCKPTSRYHKEAKLKPLLKLVNFRYSFMFDHMVVKTKLSALIVGDILKECTNIACLTVPVDDCFLSMLFKLKINSKIQTMNFLVYSKFFEQSRLEQIVDFLKRTAVKEVSVHLAYEGSLMVSDIRSAHRDEMSPQPLLSSMLAPLELNVRYFTEDFSVQI